MSDDQTVEGCVMPAGGPIAPPAATESIEPAASEEKTMSVMVGKEAPDFQASAFFGGGFRNIKLSDYRGKWVFLCFYPGDFTFV